MNWWLPNEEHERILRKGVFEWNEWRKENPEIVPILRSINLSGVDLSGINFNDAQMSAAILEECNLSRASMYQIELFGVNAKGCDFSASDLRGAKFHTADLTGASLKSTDLYRVDLIETILQDTKFDNATLDTTAFLNVDLTYARGLDSVIHRGPSYFDVHTLGKLQSPLPSKFLNDSGVPSIWIDYLPGLVKNQATVAYQSCFISYSHNDEEFARKLHRELRSRGISVWFAPEDVKAGQKLHHQIDRAISLNDRLLIVLSEHSLKSEWVTTEIRKARQLEVLNEKRKLFPLRLVDIETLRNWECFDADSGKNLAVEIREYFIPDFSDWKSSVLFERNFSKLLESLEL